MSIQTTASLVTEAAESARQTAFVEGASRGAALHAAVLAYIAATRGTAFAEKAMLAASDLAAADELAAIIVNHASRSPSVEALQACAAEVLAWAERGN